MTNWFVLSAGILAGMTALIHVIAGGKDVARPLLASAFDEVVKLTLYACWHLVSVALFLSSIALLGNGAGFYDSPEMVAFVSIMWLMFGAVFLVVTLGIAKPRGLLRFPQWAVLVPVGLLGLWGLA
jgi:hypothetical protein